jgi:hypothetical protein
VIASPPPVHPWPIGVGPRYHPPALSARVERGAPIAGMRCRSGGRTFAVHVELFADRRVVVVPRGIGRSPRGCTYPLSTAAPTGVVDVKRGSRHTLGDLFRVWGQALEPGRLLSFRGRVRVYVGGRRWIGEPRSVVLTKHLQVVVEIGRYVAPHARYLFPKGAG